MDGENKKVLKLDTYYLKKNLTQETDYSLSLIILLLKEWKPYSLATDVIRYVKLNCWSKFFFFYLNLNC